MAAGGAADGAEPLGFNLEGPLLSNARRGAHDRHTSWRRRTYPTRGSSGVADGLAVMTIAPELPGAPELIERLARARRRGLARALRGRPRRRPYRVCARGTIDDPPLQRDDRTSSTDRPGLAVAALEADDVFVELIADGHHVHPALWPLIARLKPRDRLMLVSDALSLAGTGDGRTRVGGLEVEVIDGRATLAGTTTLAGSVIALDSAVRNLVAAGITLPDCRGGCECEPGVTDRAPWIAGVIAVGRRADLVELDDDLARASRDACRDVDRRRARRHDGAAGT